MSGFRSVICITVLALAACVASGCGTTGILDPSQNRAIHQRTRTAVHQRDLLRQSANTPESLGSILLFLSDGTSIGPCAGSSPSAAFRTCRQNVGNGTQLANGTALFVYRASVPLPSRWLAISELEYENTTHDSFQQLRRDTTDIQTLIAAAKQSIDRLEAFGVDTVRLGTLQQSVLQQHQERLALLTTSTEQLRSLRTNDAKTLAELQGRLSSSLTAIEQKMKAIEEQLKRF